MRFASIGLQAGSRPACSIESARESASAGFTLLETLTAMTILAIALVSLFEAHANSVRAAGVAADSTRARMMAEALLADAASGPDVRPASRKGHDGRFAWSVDIDPERAPWARVKSALWRLNHIRVAVTWDKSRRIELETLKLGRSDG